MTLTYIPIVLDAIESLAWGILWTPRGIQIVKPGDYIVRAKTGCTWRIHKKDIKRYAKV